MHKLIFIDNDKADITAKDLPLVKNLLQDTAKLPKQEVDEMTTVSLFNQLEREEQYKILFESKAIICTYSMYTASHENSLGQLLRLLASAGRNRIQDLVYLDTSGYLFDTLNRHIDKSQHPLDILTAISNNKILTIDKGKLCQVKIDGESFQFLNYFKLINVTF